MKKEFNNNKLYIFVGHFGSGKTEVAANFALELKRYTEKVNIIDMDIVNPFFRAVDLKSYLNSQGISVIASQYAGTNLEMPSIPQNIPLILNDPNSKTILDIGGDDLGARILGSYREYILDQEYRMFGVVNVRRPRTDTVQKIKSMIEQIEKTSKIKINALINNTNLANETTVEDIVQGYKVLEKVSNELNIPIAFSCINKELLSEVKEVIGSESLIHRIKIVLPWE